LIALTALIATTLTLADKDGRTLTVSLRAGDHAAFRLVRQDGPVALVLVDPAGRERRQWVHEPGEGSDTVCPRPMRAAASWVADAPGRWTVRVLPPEGAPPFDVTIERDAAHPASARERDAWAAELADAEVTALLDEGKAAESAEAAQRLIDARERENAGDRLLLASDLGYLGIRFYASAQCRAGAWDEAERLVRRSLELRTKAGASDACVAEALSLVASIAYAQGHFEDGEGLEKRALAMREHALPERPDRWRRSLRDVGLLLLQQGKFGEAEGYLKRYQQSAEQSLDPHVVADALNVAGELYRSQNRYAEALAALARAKALEDGVAEPDVSFQADLLTALAGIHLDRADYDEAERFAKQHRDLLAAHPDVATADNIAIGKVNLGEIYRRQGRLADAEPLLTEALQTGREAFCPENPKLLYFRVDLALLYAEQGKIELAETLYRESQEAMERALGPDHPDVAASLHELAGLLAAHGRNDGARVLYERALGIRERAFGPDHPLSSVTRLRLAQARLDGGAVDLTSILAEVQRARRAIADAAAYPEEGIDAAALESAVLERAGRKDDARRALAQALDAVERLRPRRGGGEGTRADFLRRYLDAYDTMIASCLSAGDIDAAFAFTERSRARALLDLLTSGTGDLRASLDPAVRARLEAREAAAAATLAEAQSRAAYERARTDLAPEERRARVRALDRQIEKAARALQIIADDFKNNSPLWRDEVSASGAPVTLAEVRARIVPEGGVLLAYRIGRTQSTVFVVPRAPAPATALPLRISAAAAATFGVPEGPLTAEALEHMLNGDPSSGEIPLLRRLAEPSGGPTEDAPGTIDELDALRRVILPAAAWSRVRRAREALIIPDGALAQLPMEALVLRPGATWTSARLWLDLGPPIRYAASTTSLASVMAREVHASPPTVLSVSDPIVDPSLPRLPGTARESAAVVDAFRKAGFPDAVLVLSGARATERDVRAALAGRRYLHFATHAIVQPGRSELLAGLALTAPSLAVTGMDDDGMLQLFEIQRDKLDADLVVLSACDTNVGRRIAGEGVFSLARGFFAAGARRVVSSLWPVDDAATALLVGRLYGPIAQAESTGKRADVIGALRDAKRAVRRAPSSAAPFYWAAFICTGIR
jgi:tetratricopeptide (TPR) repeat protein